MTQPDSKKDTDTPGSGDQPGEDLNVDPKAVATKGSEQEEPRKGDTEA